MRKSVLTSVRVFAVVVIAAISGINTVMAAGANDFLYNITEQSDEVVVKEICKKEGEGYQLYSRNEYRYDEYGELASLEVAYWNAETRVWENDHLITYNRDQIMNTQEIAYMKWNKENAAYDAASEKAVSQLTSENVLQSYVHYSMDAENGEWQVQQSVQ